MTDRIDERRMCERLLRITGNKSETIVVVNGVGGGLGHKYRSTGLEVTYALIARKRLYCECQWWELLLVLTPPGILNVTDTCFKRREFKKCNKHSDSLTTSHHIHESL